ncbi:nuclear transport factor 2 family protein [Granulosicoccaceae sp. 1_MG-2023]|nr:nuclear transport factor 2 family protein [Granulosicoccaceae sp. 1_MG-2023]
MKAFYEACAERNPAKLRQVWHPDSAVCIVEGTLPVTGLNSIMATWSALFRHNTAPLIHINTLNHSITPHCEIFLVEQRTGKTAGRAPEQALHYANNVFLKTRQGWRLSCHHAFAPAELKAPPTATLH